MRVLTTRRILVIAAAAVGAFALFFPARQLISQRERIHELESRRDALRAENRRLADEARRLADPAEVEVLARDRLGLVRPGERAYFVDGSGAKGVDPPAVSEPSVWSRVWSWVTSVVRGRG
jgi:cell division protein FtsB